MRSIFVISLTLFFSVSNLAFGDAGTSKKRLTDLKETCGVVKGLRDQATIVFEDKDLTVFGLGVWAPFLAASMAAEAQICVKTYVQQESDTIFEILRK